MNEHIQRRLRQLRNGSITAEESARYLRKHAASFGGLHAIGTSDNELLVWERTGIIKKAKKYLSSFKEGILMWGSESTVTQLEEYLKKHSLKAEDIGITQEELASLPAEWITRKAQQKESYQKYYEKEERIRAESFVQNLPVFMTKWLTDEVTPSKILNEYQYFQKSFSAHLAVLREQGVDLKSLGVIEDDLHANLKAIARLIALQCTLFFISGAFPFDEVHSYEPPFGKFSPSSHESPEWKVFCEALHVAGLLPKDVGLTETFEEVLKITKQLQIRRKIQTLRKTKDNQLDKVAEIKYLCALYQVSLFEAGSSQVEIDTIVRHHFRDEAHKLWNDPAWAQDHPWNLEKLQKALQGANITMDDLGGTNEELLRRKLEWLEYRYQKYLNYPSIHCYRDLRQYADDPDINTGTYELVPPFNKRNITLAYAAVLAKKKVLRVSDRKTLLNMIKKWKFTGTELGSDDKLLLTPATEIHS